MSFHGDSIGVVAVAGGSSHSLALKRRLFERIYGIPFPTST